MQRAHERRAPLQECEPGRHECARVDIVTVPRAAATASGSRASGSDNPALCPRTTLRTAAAGEGSWALVNIA